MSNSTTTAILDPFIRWADTAAGVWSHWALAGPNPPRPLTEAERAERRAQEEAWERENQARYAETRARTEAVRNRATELLLSHLNEEQRRCFRERGFFYVAAPGSGRLYRIDRHTHGNVRVVDPITKDVLETLCIQPDNVPAEDAMLVQKLQIEIDEERFRRAANITERASGGRLLHRAEPIFLPAGGM